MEGGEAVFIKWFLGQRFRFKNNFFVVLLTGKKLEIFNTAQKCLYIVEQDS